MNCPDCGAAVEADQDFCLECGEPIAGMKPLDGAASAPKVAAAASAPKTAPRVRRPPEEPDPIRCPGCGVPSRRTRCPGCGTRLRSDDA